MLFWGCFLLHNDIIMKMSASASALVGLPPFFLCLSDAAHRRPGGPDSSPWWCHGCSSQRSNIPALMALTGSLSGRWWKACGGGGKTPELAYLTTSCGLVQHVLNPSAGSSSPRLSCSILRFSLSYVDGNSRTEFSAFCVAGGKCFAGICCCGWFTLQERLCSCSCVAS